MSLIDTAVLVPSEPPSMSELKLVTMTIDAKLHHNFNLRAVATKIKIDHQICGVKYLNVLKGDYADGPMGKFKNQCTFRINVGDKVINTKLFNNGEIVNVGCLCQDHAIKAIEILVNRFKGLEADLVYEIPDRFKCKDLKKFFKDEIRKKYGMLFQMLILYFGMKTDLGPFDETLLADESYCMFTDILYETGSYARDILYIHNVISILKCYFSEENNDIITQFDTPPYQMILSVITDGTSEDYHTIKCRLPVCLNSMSIQFNNVVCVELINKGTNCNYFINRKELTTLLENMKDPDSNKPFTVRDYKYHKSYYPGVIIQYAVPGKIVKIIIFHTGKINITSANTEEQITHAYNFIRQICYDHFSQLLLTTAYENKKIEYESSLPDQHLVGSENGQTNYLLKKKDILKNPRNVRILHSMGLLDLYKVGKLDTTVISA
jgi:TATA-box binding protein (TBP) (component of TFIID and TFIIIB)